jgi:hypothetical protein
MKEKHHGSCQTTRKRTAPPEGNALRREFADWRARSQANQPLGEAQVADRPPHCATGGLSGRHAGDPDPAAPSFADNERIYTRLLGAHRIWAYFRSKLALRDVALAAPVR